MKQLTKIMMILLALLVFGVGQVWAYPIADDSQIVLSVTSGQTGGYGVGYASNPTDVLFTTFCLEKDVYFYLNSNNQSYAYAATFSDSVMGGTKSNQVARGGLHDGTKYLYWNFVHNQNVLVEAAGWTNDKAGITALQEAIWALQRPLYTSVNSTAWPLVAPTGLAATLYEIASAIEGSNLDVKVVNLWTSQGVARQSQLIAGSAPVPEPGTLLLLGSGLAGLALYRRRAKK